MAKQLKVKEPTRRQRGGYTRTEEQAWSETYWGQQQLHLHRLHTHARKVRRRLAERSRRANRSAA